MKRGRAPDPPDDACELFRRAVAGAQPLPDRGKVHIEPPPAPAVPTQRLRDERAALHESLHAPVSIELRLEGGDEPTYLREGLPRSVLRDLRRGRWVIQDELDLHGSNRDQARIILAEFLAECLRRELRCVRVIHGKGLRSPGREPVLKRLVQGWLARRSEILAYCQARTAAGGAGAMLVLLRAA
jgi:DNA-nicking Smr family endonuclease